MKDEKAVSNKLIDSDWDKLTGSMLSVYGVNTCQSILKSDSKLKTSNLSLCGEAEIDSNLDRSKSVTVLTSMEQQNQEQVHTFYWCPKKYGVIKIYCYI